MELRVKGSVYPQVYQKFLANGEEFHVGDLTEEHTEQALDLIDKFLIPEENFCKAIQIHTKKNAVKCMMEAYRELFAKKMSLACVKADTGELVGLNILVVKTRGEEDRSEVGLERFSCCLSFQIDYFHFRTKILT